MADKDAFSEARDIGWLLYRLVACNTRDQKTKAKVTISGDGALEVLMAVKASQTILEAPGTIAKIIETGDEMTLYGVDFKFERTNK